MHKLPILNEIYILFIFSIRAEKSEKKNCVNIKIYAPIESLRQSDSKNVIFKVLISDSDEKNRKKGQKYEFPII